MMDNDQLVARIDERLKSLGERMETTERRILERFDAGERRMNDHSKRLRELENWRWFLVGGLALLAIIVKALT